MSHGDAGLLIREGAVCFYVPEYADRPLIGCRITGPRESSSRNSYIYPVDAASADSILGTHFFVEFSLLGRLTDPGNIIPVRVYTSHGAWENDPVMSGRDVIEFGFMCSQTGLEKHFGLLGESGS
jgi:hypothetical protein